MSESSSREVVEDLFAVTSDGVALLGSDGHLRVNEEYARAFGADSTADLLDRSWRDLYDDGATDRIRAALDGDEETATVESARCTRVDGESVVVDLSIRSTVDGVLVVVHGRGDGTIVMDDAVTLHDALQEIQQARTVEAVSEAAVTAVDEVLGWPRVACWWHEAADDTLRGKACWPDGTIPLRTGDPEYEIFESGDFEELPADGTWTARIEGFEYGVAIPVGDRGLLAAATTVDAPDPDWDLDTLEVLATQVETALDRIEREHRLQQSERRYRTLAEHMPDTAVALYEPTGDGDLRYTLVSGPVFDSLEADPDDLQGKRFTEAHSEWFVRDHLTTYQAALEGEHQTIEHTLEGRIFQGYTIPIEDEHGEVVSGMAMTRDVTEQREYERELRRKERQYRTLAENIPGAAIALFDQDLRYTTVAGSIYDEIDRAREAREGMLLEEFHDEAFLEDHLSKFEAALDGEESTFQYTAYDRVFDAHMLPVVDDGEVISGMVVVLDVTDQVERERELERQRDELETLNRINGLLLSITRALSEAPSREEVESIVCERLADSDLYRFAWIGEYAPGDDLIVPRTSAGVEEGYLDEVSITTGVELTGLGPGGEALRSREIQVVGDVLEDERFEPWREPATERGYRSVIGVPICHDDVVYGLLAVYSARPDAFSDTEQAAFADLGETIGFVINALQNRKLLVADAVTELTFEIADADSLLASASRRLDATVSLDGFTETDEETWIGYISIDGGDPRTLCEILSEDETVETAWVIEEREDGGLVGIRDTDPVLVRSALAVGATISSASATDGRLRIVVEVPGSTEVRTVVDLLRGVFPDIELVARRERDHPAQTTAQFRESLEGELTERQLATLRAAYYAGYFEWPRESTAEDVAESMGIASATLHNHLRKAQKRLLTLFFDEDRDSLGSADG